MSQKSNYEALFITHLPSFYKNNIFNEIAKTRRILVLFVGRKGAERNSDFTAGRLDFEHIFLSNGAFENAKNPRSIWKMWRILGALEFDKIIVGGWDLVHFWAALGFCKIFRRRVKTATIVESSLIESRLSPAKLALKKIFLSLNSAIIAAGGGQHRGLIEKISPRFAEKNEIFIANGVGIPNIFYQIQGRDSSEDSGRGDGLDSRQNITPDSPKVPLGFAQNPAKNIALKSPPLPSPLQTPPPKNPHPPRFIFIGRIAPEKNLPLLFRAFESSPFYLDVIGGDISRLIDAKKHPNIRALGAIDNANLGGFLRGYTALILPSRSETWGLVVEEALLCGTPAVVSENVGCARDLVEDFDAGVVFKNDDLDSLKIALKIAAASAPRFATNALKIDFTARYEAMKRAYLLEK